VDEKANKEALVKALNPPGQGSQGMIGSNIVLGGVQSLKRLQELQAVARPELAQAFAAVGDTTAQVVVTLSEEGRKTIDERLPELPKPLGGGSTKPFTEGIQWAALGMDVTPAWVKLQVQAPNAKAAKALHEALVGLFAAVGEVKEVRDAFPEFNKLAAALTPTGKGDRLTATPDDKLVLNAMVTGVMQVREAAKRIQSANNLRQMVIAMHNYLDVNQRFPTYANFDNNGKPLLSWRVHLLPFLEQDELYKQFHLDEPWDSAHNKKLIAKMPSIYALPGNSKLRKDGKTIYLAPLGETTMFPGPRPVKITDVTDGTSNTIFLVEADDDHAAIWTKPDDLHYDATKPFQGLGKRWNGGFWAAFVDASVHMIPATVDKETLKALFTIAGGEVVNVP
jgi:hypothetical protein